MGKVIMPAEIIDSRICEARRLLKVWASWLGQGGRHGCRGYPRASAFIHANEGDIKNMHVEPENEEAERVERAMCVLKRFNMNVFKSLRYEYELKLSNREAAERLNVSTKTFKVWREKGEYFIAGKIIA